MVKTIVIFMADSSGRRALILHRNSFWVGDCGLNYRSIVSKTQSKGLSNMHSTHEMPKCPKVLTPTLSVNIYNSNLSLTGTRLFGVIIL